MSDSKFKKGEVAIVKNERGFSIGTVIESNGDIVKISYMDKLTKKPIVEAVHATRLFKETEVSEAVLNALL